MSQKKYAGIALSPEQLLNQLKSKGLIIQDDEHAVHCLNVVSYHRLSSYFSPFTSYHSAEWLFKPDTNFEDIWKLYVFDRELRLLIIDALERIEVAFRTAISDTMCRRYEPHWYLDASLFKHPHLHSTLLEKINKICQRREEASIRHYYNQYCHPDLPPCWVVIEHLPFGACTSALHNLKDMHDKKRICDVLGHHPIAVASWMDALRYTRNLCAHHARLWNRWFVMVPKLGYFYGGKFAKERTFYAQAIVIERLLRVISPGTHWSLKLYNLLDNNCFVPIHQMGFAENWRDDSFWTMRK